MISPLDGKYRHRLEDVEILGDEHVLVAKYNIMVDYILMLATRLLLIDQKQGLQIKTLQMVPSFFGENKAFLQRFRAHEKTHGHEIYSLIRMLSQDIEALGMPSVAAMVNYGLTSEDIVNIALRVQIKHHVEHTLVRQMGMLMKTLGALASECEGIDLMGMTHGQPATAVRMASVFTDYSLRMNAITRLFCATKLNGKIGGATGERRAFELLDQSVDWHEALDKFVTKYRLRPIRVSSQVNPNDDLSELFGYMVTLNAALLDLSRDMWLYMMRGVIRMEKPVSTVGSSAMPHKVNPIEFENAEGNIGLSTAIFQHMAQKIPVSRMQRDLSDSTVLRNIAVPFAHQYLAIDSLIAGLMICSPNKKVVEAELNSHPQVASELEQARMKLNGIIDAHDDLRKKWRGGAR